MNVILSMNVRGLASEKRLLKPLHWGHISRIL